MRNENDQSEEIESAYIASTLLGIQELKKNLVTQIAHNFRTPLTSVIGFAEMLLDDRPLSDEQRVEYARFIQYEGIRLSKLIDDVLQLSALEGGDTQLNVRQCILQEVVAEGIARISDFARARFVKVKRNLTSTPLMVHLDREKMTEAIYQLLHNAIRFTKQNDEVEVTTGVIGEYVEIKIRDGGPGITEQEIPTLFDGVRNAYRPEKDSRGIGVGLSIVKQILDLHHGEIQVQSNKGEGSLFILRIPGKLE